jgi:hypothetical protein
MFQARHHDIIAEQIIHLIKEGGASTACLGSTNRNLMSRTICTYMVFLLPLEPFVCRMIREMALPTPLTKENTY